MNLPADVPGMIHAAYVDRNLPEVWRPLWERGRAVDAEKDAKAKSRADGYRLPDPWSEPDLRSWGQSTEPDDDAIIDLIEEHLPV